MYLRSHDGSAIFFRCIGNGFPILFLHGNNLSSDYFQNQLELAKQYKLIFIDSRAQGKSDLVTSSISFEKLTEDVNQVLEHLSINSCLIVGHSDGANLAISFCQKYPNKVKGLILNSGNVTFNGLRILSRIGILIELFFLRLLSKRSLYFKSKLLVAKLMKEEIKLDKERLRMLTFPTWVVVGSCDIIKLSHSEEICLLFPNSRLIKIKSQGHNVAKEEPLTFNKLIVDMMDLIQRRNQS
ncbi:hypothetical protein HMPREF9318_00908 [Streptococcus urinalis FB127-CNA-2]|uniref:Ndr domain protein n=1 Tax=Streptococcus urinalis 2285-97 TaxID=764291 RepID=G5KGP2_9STRE|nr:alpha/beta hydrolase [Streptococcus urinalis]EHJ57092.1 Ndr domain protein [Streptococcus urinalis 2285-97]EKS20954.1 hypothetical protein HMPREF9318_00908 [Streptococcus urinalis FB127-CNA-2]VEF30963.1 alpha/beta superfamily hydrolase [Streptococcus urinalis]